MKTKVSASPITTWPHGVEVVVSSQGILLKAKPKPRQGWAKEFKSSSVDKDETSGLRTLKNNFDSQEWEW